MPEEAMSKEEAQSKKARRLQEEERAIVTRAIRGRDFCGSCKSSRFIFWFCMYRKDFFGAMIHHGTKFERPAPDPRDMNKLNAGTSLKGGYTVRCMLYRTVVSYPSEITECDGYTPKTNIKKKRKRRRSGSSSAMTNPE